MPVSKKDANHIVARVCGVKEGDSKIDAANKLIETLRMAGYTPRQLKKFEKMRDDAIRRGVK